jgi:hypothetical protein
MALALDSLITLAVCGDTFGLTHPPAFARGRLWIEPDATAAFDAPLNDGVLKHRSLD